MSCLSSPRRKLFIVISHNNFLSLKMPVKAITQLETSEHHMLMVVKCDIKSAECMYTLALDLSLNLPKHLLPKEPLSLDELITLSQQITQFCNKMSCRAIIVQLCCDPNLGSVAGDWVTDEFHALVHGTKPRSLFLFTDTPLCVDDTLRYLHRKPAGQHDQCVIPNTVKNGFVCERQLLARALQNEYIRPTLLPPIPLYHRFFSTNSTFQALHNMRTIVPLESSTHHVHH